MSLKDEYFCKFSIIYFDKIINFRWFSSLTFHWNTWPLICEYNLVKMVLWVLIKKFRKQTFKSNICVSARETNEKFNVLWPPAARFVIILQYGNSLSWSLWHGPICCQDWAYFCFEPQLKISTVAGSKVLTSCHNIAHYTCQSFPQKYLCVFSCYNLSRFSFFEDFQGYDVRKCLF